MKHWPIYRELDTQIDGSHIVRLADFFNDQFDVGTLEADCRSSLTSDDHVFARGRFRTRVVRPFVQCVDCNLEMLSDFQITSVHQPSLSIAMLLKGSWTSRIGNHFHHAPSLGVPSLIKMDQPMEYTSLQKSKDTARAIAICIHPDFFDTLDGFGDDVPFSALTNKVSGGFAYQEFAGCTTLQLALRRLYDNPYRGALANLYAESLILSALVEIISHLHGQCSSRRHASPRDQDFAREARRIIDRDLGSAPTIAAMAAGMGIGEASLRRAFKQVFGVTIYEYIRDQRLEAARLMLRSQHVRVSEVAFRVGYADPANFSNAYKQRFGHAPKFEL